MNYNVIDNKDNRIKEENKQYRVGEDYASESRGQKII